MNKPLKHQRMGVVVIGQSPRPSVAAEIAAVLSPGITIELRGALDGMSRAEIDAIPPMDGYDTLFTLLPNGDGVTISKKAVEARAAIQIEKFASEGVKVAMLACTGKFPNLAPDGLVILPSAARLGNFPVQAISVTPTPSCLKRVICWLARRSTSFLLMVTPSPFGSSVNSVS